MLTGQCGTNYILQRLHLQKTNDFDIWVNGLLWVWHRSNIMEMNRLGLTCVLSPAARFFSLYTVTCPSLSPTRTQSVSRVNSRAVGFTPGLVTLTIVGSRLLKKNGVHCKLLDRKTEHQKLFKNYKCYWIECKTLPTDSQVPDLHLALTDSSKDSSTVWGPHDIKHNLLTRGETQHGFRKVLPPQINSPIWRTA